MNYPPYGPKTANEGNYELENRPPLHVVRQTQHSEKPRKSWLLRGLTALSLVGGLG